MTTRSALPETLAEQKLQQKSQQESSFSSSHVPKTHLSEWDLNALNTSALPSKSLHMGCQHQMPLRLLDMGQMMETEAYAERGSTVWEPENTFQS